MARGRLTTKLQLRQAAMIRHQMARLFALTVMRIRILLAANNTKLESAEDEEREAECLSFFSTLDMASILELKSVLQHLQL